jgi:(methylthio)acryloyl-CoA hydratase
MVNENLESPVSKALVSATRTDRLTEICFPMNSVSQQIEADVLSIERRESVAVLHLNRPAKRNAINDALLSAIARFFYAPPDGLRAVVLAGQGDHFSGGLDLSEHRSRSAFEVMQHSQLWHRTFDRIQFSGLPVVTAMQGAVIGGGLELATATHVRVAESSTFYALPEGRRGIYVGGGASVRVARIIGAGRMTEMMLTGRRVDAETGQQLGLSHHLVGAGEALDKALELADLIATNAPLSNYAILNAVTRIDNMSMTEGLFTESLVAALTQTGAAAQEQMDEFLQRRRRE